MGDGPLASAIVIFGRGSIEPCLPSLLDQKGVKFEIVAVAPDDHTASLLPDNELIKPVIAPDRNPAMRRNLAATRSTGRYLAFIDDDATAPQGWLAKAVRFLEMNPVYAGVGGPNLVPGDASARELVTDMVLTAPLVGAGSRAYRGGGRRRDARPGELHLVNLVVRRDWFERIGGFNEQLGYGAEDTEFIYSAARLGGKFMFGPDLFVYHRRRAFGPAYFKQRFKLRMKSAELFIARPGVYAKNMSFWTALLGPPALLALLILAPGGREAPVVSALALLYLASALALPWRSIIRRPWLALTAPPAFALHHAVNLAGLWTGILWSLLRGPWRVRRRIKRKMDSCSI